MWPVVDVRTAGSITRKVLVSGTWHGSRHGIKIELKLTDQPTLNGKRIEWRARIRKTWKQGKAGTVYEALQEIANAWAAERNK